MAADAIDLSIVVGTLNRASLLERAVESLLAQHAPRTHIEIVVVDNGSTDDTASRVAGLTRRASRVHYVREPRLGLSHARNTGILHATGGIVAFLDDDAEADPDWTERLMGVFRDDPGAGAAGGRTHVLWPDVRPEWMPLSLESYYGKCDYGDRRKPLTFPEYPFGSNMAIRRELLLELGGFRTDLGARGNNLMAGEETDLFERLHERDVRVVYEPEAVVRHRAAPQRLTRRWSLRRAFKHGVSTAFMCSGGRNSRFPSTLRLSRALRLSALGAAATLVGWATTADSATMMSRAANTAYWAGYARGAIGQTLRRITGQSVTPLR